MIYGWGRFLRMVAFEEVWSFEVILPIQASEGSRSMDSFCEFVRKISLMILKLESKSTLLNLKKTMSCSIILSPGLMKCIRIGQLEHEGRKSYDDKIPHRAT